tara:strand:+ start:63 stop:392 length:330 start_codon:yes stop_codon:yes gene_type:complete
MGEPLPKDAFEFDFDLDAQEDWGEIGFSTEDDLRSGEYEAKAEIDQTKTALDSMKEDYEKRMRTLEKAIVPLLVNLAKNPEREYILWPNRKEKIEAQIDKILSLTRTYT